MKNKPIEVRVSTIMSDIFGPAPSTGCGCETMTRCDKHRAMMKVIHEKWNAAGARTSHKIWNLQDGYGISGYTPSQGYDWSGIRDSSVAAVEAMYEVCK